MAIYLTFFNKLKLNLTNLIFIKIFAKIKI